MPVLDKSRVLRSSAVAQASHQSYQRARRYYSSKTSHPRTFDHAAFHKSTPTVHPLSGKIIYTPSSPPTPTDPAPRLGPAAKAGIITACIIVFILLFLLTLELAYLRRQRRAGAVQQARRGVELGGVELEEVRGESVIKENAVLESRVEIIVEGEEEEEIQGSSVRGSLRKGWEEDGETDGGVEGWGRERMGMSLQRRVY